MPRTAMGRTHPRTDATAAAFSCSATQCGVAAAVVPIASCCISHHAPRAAATLPQTRSSLPSAPAACSTRRSSAPPRRMPPRTPATPSRTTYTWRTTCNVHLPRDMHRATYNETLMGGGGGVSQGSPGKAAPRNTRLEGSSGAGCVGGVRVYAVCRIRASSACVQACRRPAPLVCRAAHRRCRATVAERTPFASRVHTLPSLPTHRIEIRTARVPAVPFPGPCRTGCGRSMRRGTSSTPAHSSEPVALPLTLHPTHPHAPPRVHTHSIPRCGLPCPLTGSPCDVRSLCGRRAFTSHHRRVLRFASRSAPPQSCGGTAPPCDAPRRNGIRAAVTDRHAMALARHSSSQCAALSVVCASGARSSRR